jgi:hypothetical protein
VDYYYAGLRCVSTPKCSKSTQGGVLETFFLFLRFLTLSNGRKRKLNIFKNCWAKFDLLLWNYLVCFTVQGVLLNGITDNGISWLMVSTLSWLKSPKLLFLPNFISKLIHLLLLVGYWDQFVSIPNLSH